MALAVKKSTERLPSVLPLEQAHDLFEREAWRLVGVSGEVFLARWDAGEYQDLDDTPEGRKIAYLALLIPFGRRVS
jgi:hypothetical protein